MFKKHIFEKSTPKRIVTSIALGVLGGVGRGLDSLARQKSVRGNWPLWSPVVSLKPSVTSRWRREGQYIEFQSFKDDMATKIIMLKCFDHKTTFLDTQRYFRPAIEIVLENSHRLRGFRAQKEQLKKVWLDSQRMQYYVFVFSSFLFSKRLTWNKTSIWECSRNVKYMFEYVHMHRNLYWNS